MWQWMHALEIDAEKEDKTTALKCLIIQSGGKEKGGCQRDDRVNHAPWHQPS